MLKAKLHAGTQAECIVCTPDRKKKRERFADRKPRYQGGASLEINVRRQMAEEIGEDELSKDFRFQLMQKYGVIAARIDRRITKPSWMENSRWNQLKQEFHKATKGLVPQQQNRTRSTTRPAGAVQPQNRQSTKKWSEIHHKKYNGPKPPRS